MSGISNVGAQASIRRGMGFGGGREPGASYDRAVPAVSEPRPWRLLESDSTSADHELEAGDDVYLAGAPAERLFVVRRGVLEFRVDRRDGWSQVVGEVGPGEAFGLAALGGGCYESTARMRARGSILSVSAQSIRRLVATSSDLAFRLFEASQIRHASQVQLAAELALLTLEQRLVRFILRRGMDGSWAYSHEEIAIRLGGCREEVTRLLSKLKRKGLIRIGRRRVEVLNEEGLRALEVPLGGR